MTDTLHELQIGSKHSAFDWNQYYRDIAVSHFINNPVQIGCPEHMVEIDESLFSRRIGFLEVTILQPWKAFCCQFHIGMPLL